MAKASRKTPPAPKASKAKGGKATGEYRYPDQTVLMRPEIGTQSQFRKKKPPQTYRYDSSLSPARCARVAVWFRGAGIVAGHGVPYRPRCT